MRIFITGGTGFIGKPLTELLSREGHKVLVLSRRPPPVSLKNIKFLKGSLSQISRFKKQLQKFNPEAAIHLAWEGIPDYASRQSLKNLKYSLDLFAVLQKIGCRKILTAGTCWEYGDKIGKLKESSLIGAKPLNAFALAKSRLRTLALRDSAEHGFAFIWAVLFYVYGPGQKKSSLIPSLLTAFGVNKTPDVKNPGAGNDFVYVGDVVKAMAMIVKKARRSAVYNIGSGQVTRVSEIVRLIYPNFAYKLRVLKPAPSADISKIKKEIGWHPETDIKTGMRMTRAWFQKK